MNKYIEKIAGLSKEADFAGAVASGGRRIGRLAKGVAGTVGELADVTTGSKVKDVMKEGTKVKVTNPFTRHTYMDDLGETRLNKIHDMKDSEKIVHLTKLHGADSEHVSKLKSEINKRDAMRLAVGGTATYALGKHIKNKLDERKAYEQYYGVQ